MLTIKNINIDTIPTLEISPSHLENQAAPLVVFYHGWTSSKDASIAYGTEIAKRGFRVLIPEAINHGQRIKKEVDIHQHSILFFSTLVQNVLEFPQIVSHYQDQKLILNDKMSVAGVSMGGMTTSMLLNKYPEIKSSVVLMGTPQQEKFNDWLIQKALEEYQGPQNFKSPAAFSSIEKSLIFMKEHDLSANMEAINSRPLFFWHAKADQVVPYKFTEDFVQEVQVTSSGSNTYLKLDDKGMHRVPYIEIARMAEFLQASYQVEENQIWDRTNQRIKEIFIHQS